MINAFLFWFLIMGCMAFAGFIIVTAWPKKPERPKPTVYECPMPWQQEEFERE